jgi:hypothetical protein
MSLDTELLKMLAEAMETEYLDVTGRPKPLRFFTAADCRNYAENRGDPSVAELADVIEENDVVTVGEAVAYEKALTNLGCPRCAFGNAIAEVVYSGDYIEQHYSDQLPLIDTEKQLVALARDWLLDDTIAKCLDEEIP